MRNSFKVDFLLENRQVEAQSVLVNYPDQVPVIVEKAGWSRLPEMTDRMFLVSRGLTVEEFVRFLRNKMSCKPPTVVLFFESKKIRLPKLYTMDTIYAKYKDTEDGLLYIVFSTELI